MGQPSDHNEVRIGHYLRVVTARWSVLVITTLLGAAAALGYLIATPKAVTASTEVNINVISTDPFAASKSASGLLDGTTEVQIASSYVVSSSAAEALGGRRTANEIRQNLTVVAVSDATVIRISYTDQTAARAETGADAIAAAYLSYRATEAQEKLSSMLQGIQTRSDELREALIDANTRAGAAAAGSSAANQAASDRDLVTIEINSLLSQKNTLERIDTSGGSVLTPATENEVVTAPSTKTVLLGGVVGGLILGFILAFPINAFDKRIRRARDVQHATGAPVIVELAGSQGHLPAEGDSLEDLRLARERVLAAMTAEAGVLALIDASSSSISDVGINLALLLAQDRHQVELILPGLPQASVNGIAAALGLRIVEQDEDGTVYGSRRARDISFYFSSLGHDAFDADEVMTESVRVRIENARRDRLVVLVLPVAARRATIVAAQRLSDAMVLVVQKRAVKADVIRSVVGDFRDADVSVLGSVVLAKGRTYVLPSRTVGVLEPLMPSRSTARHTTDVVSTDGSTSSLTPAGQAEPGPEEFDRPSGASDSSAELVAQAIPGDDEENRSRV